MPSFRSLCTKDFNIANEDYIVINNSALESQATAADAIFLK